jgi:uncharacterized protein (DUF2062 family)
MFKRRDARSWGRVLTESVYPRGGWRRAASYVGHRLRRLPDAPHRIARGVFAGIFVSFLPLFGFHFVTAAALAFVLRGNILAALFATFVGNPLTFPFIAAAALETGKWLLSGDEMVPLAQIGKAFGSAAGQLWHNLLVLLFGTGETYWDSLSVFYHSVFLPYMVGGIPTGIIAGLTGYYLSLPVLNAYQKRRLRKLAERAEKQRATGRRGRGPAAPRDGAAPPPA